jgi:hypothetical protein
LKPLGHNVGEGFALINYLISFWWGYPLGGFRFFFLFFGDVDFFRVGGLLNGSLISFGS